MPCQLGLEIDQFGPVALPLNDLQARYFAKMMCQRKDDVVEEIEASRVRIKNTKWNGQLRKLVANVGKKLGCLQTDELVPELERLVLVRKRDEYGKKNSSSVMDVEMMSDEDDGRRRCEFAKLVIQLPSRYTAESVIEVRDEIRSKVKKLEMGEKEGLNEFGVFYAAFYSGSDFEWMKVTSGFALCLVYSLGWSNGIYKNILIIFPHYHYHIKT